MNTSEYRQKMREGMSVKERNEELFRFSDYINNGQRSEKAKKRFKRKPYNVGVKAND